MTAMAVTMSVEKAATEAAISYRAILRPAPVGVGPLVWSAVVAHEAHRYGADGRSAHQRQDHPARSFHGTTCVFRKTGFGKIAGETRSSHGMVSSTNFGVRIVSVRKRANRGRKSRTRSRSRRSRRGSRRSN